jgi:hypothetical protein
MGANFKAIPGTMRVRAIPGPRPVYARWRRSHSGREGWVVSQTKGPRYHAGNQLETMGYSIGRRQALWDS